MHDTNILGTDVDFLELRDIANEPQYLNVLHVNKFKDLSYIRDSLVRRLLAIASKFKLIIMQVVYL